METIEKHQVYYPSHKFYDKRAAFLKGTSSVLNIWGTETVQSLLQRYRKKGHKVEDDFTDDGAALSGDLINIVQDSRRVVTCKLNVPLKKRSPNG